MTRSISEAASDAVSGKDETLWRACNGLRSPKAPGVPPWPLSTSEAERIIRAMSPAQHALYNIEQRP